MLRRTRTRMPVDRVDTSSSHHWSSKRRKTDMWHFTDPHSNPALSQEKANIQDAHSENATTSPAALEAHIAELDITTTRATSTSQTSLYFQHVDKNTARAKVKAGRASHVALTQGHQLAANRGTAMKAMSCPQAKVTQSSNSVRTMLCMTSSAGQQRRILSQGWRSISIRVLPARSKLQRRRSS